ncbi:hypothetical protein [Amaricoccus sp.]|nr:hypothetical protein [Amaricoccus sp.]HRO13179.1 hypothetical protein [Amaricoccus sp.]
MTDGCQSIPGFSTTLTDVTWLDREKLVADAQTLIPTAAAILREARRG